MEKKNVKRFFSWIFFVNNFVIAFKKGAAVKIVNFIVKNSQAKNNKYTMTSLSTTQRATNLIISSKLHIHASEKI